MVELAIIVKLLLGETLEYDIETLLQLFAAGEGIDVVGDVLCRYSPHYATDETSAGEAVDHSELLGGSYGMAQRYDVANNAHLDIFGQHGDGSGGDVTGRLDIESSEVVLVGHDAIEALLLAAGPLFHVLHVGLVHQLRIAEAVAESSLPTDLGNVRVGKLVELQKLHDSFLLYELGNGPRVRPGWLRVAKGQRGVNITHAS